MDSHSLPILCVRGRRQKNLEVLTVGVGRICTCFVCWFAGFCVFVFLFCSCIFVILCCVFVVLCLLFMWFFGFISLLLYFFVFLYCVFVALCVSCLCFMFLGLFLIFAFLFLCVLFVFSRINFHWNYLQKDFMKFNSVL